MTATAGRAAKVPFDVRLPWLSRRLRNALH